ncbi:hypothetical protein KCU93_g137, partial [Aureobasidium melanogenum]
MTPTGPYHVQVLCHGFMITLSCRTDGAPKCSEQFRFDLLVMAGLAPSSFEDGRDPDRSRFTVGSGPWASETSNKSYRYTDLELTMHICGL